MKVNYKVGVSPEILVFVLDLLGKDYRVSDIIVTCQRMDSDTMSISYSYDREAKSETITIHADGQNFELPVNQGKNYN